MRCAATGCGSSYWGWRCSPWGSPPWVATLATALVIGALLVVGGVAETVGAFWCRGWGGFFLHLLSGVLSLVVGGLFITAPADAVFALTLLMSCFLMVSGLFRIIAALSHRFTGWAGRSRAVSSTLTWAC